MAGSAQDKPVNWSLPRAGCGRNICVGSFGNARNMSICFEVRYLKFK